MSNPWFRLYSEFSHDPKVQMMSEAMQRRYIMILCLRCSNALVTLHETEIAFHLRITDAELDETKALFINRGFIDNDWNLLNWDKRQFKSDSSTERVSRYRENKKKECNNDVTLQKRQSNALEQNRTDTDTEQKHIRTKVKTPSAENAVAFNGTTWINTESHIELWAKAYPALNLKTELSKAAAWLVANPKNTKSNYARFLTNWFARAQDRAPANSALFKAQPAKQNNADRYLSSWGIDEQETRNERDITGTSKRLD